VALPEDSRNVVADDLDGDGRMDLVVTTFEAWPETKQTLRVFLNTLPTEGSWIGFRLRDAGSMTSPIGARVTVHHSSAPLMRVIVTGDSYRSQHANTAHFGLGNEGRVTSVEVRWPGGRISTIPAPAVNRYYDVRPN
jgi:hypothetical protein